MAGVGPKVETMVVERSAVMADYREKRNASIAVEKRHSNIFTDKAQAEIAPVSNIAIAAAEHLRSLSNELFASLNAALSEGGDSARYARQALKNHGLKVNKAKFKQSYVTGIVLAGRGPDRYNFNLWHDKRRTGLKLSAIKSETDYLAACETQP